MYPWTGCTIHFVVVPAGIVMMEDEISGLGVVSTRMVSPASVTESLETSLMVALFPSPSAAISKLPISSPPAASAAPSPRDLGPDLPLGRYLALPMAAVGSTALMRCMVISPLQKNELSEVTPVQIPTTIRFTSDPPSDCPIAET